MRKVLLVVSVAVLLAMSFSRAVAQDVNAPIHQMLDGFNAEDMKAVAASYASGDILIVDEVPPYRWYGPHANDEWLADLDKHDKAHGVSNGKVKYSATARTEIEGDHAYALVPVSYTYQEKGEVMREEAHMTFVLHREGGAWKIAGWVWGGGKPHAVK